MKAVQKLILFLLALGSLAAVSAVGISVIPLAAGQTPHDTPIEMQTASPQEAAQAFVPVPGTTLTPFQPWPNTPTQTASPLPTQTPTPTVTPLPSATPTPPVPDSVMIDGIWGYPQAYNLSCESRSAADLARFFGVHFEELAFHNSLPKTENPDTGFVGDVHGYLGQLPPQGYGVHAGPVAELLQEFGLDARARFGMDLEQIKAELAAGRPVMVWAISALAYSQPVEYTDSQGNTTTVARYEHTFIVIGYNQTFITVLDNEKVYSVTTERFLRSWGVLGNMGIVVNNGSD